jgi:poly(A) polymerase
LLVLGGDSARLRLTRAEARALAQMQAALGDMQPPAALAYRLGGAMAQDVTLARAALFETPLPDRWQDQIARGAQARFPVSARDLPDLQGAALGARLKALETTWIASDFTATKAQLLASR